MAQATAQQIDARWALFGMKSSRDSLPDGTGSFTTPLVWMFRATKAGALYAIIVFLIGFILGAISSSPIGLLCFEHLAHLPAKRLNRIGLWQEVDTRVNQ